MGRKPVFCSNRFNWHGYQPSERMRSDNSGWRSSRRDPFEVCETAIHQWVASATNIDLVINTHAKTDNTPKQKAIARGNAISDVLCTHCTFTWRKLIRSWLPSVAMHITIDNTGQQCNHRSFIVIQCVGSTWACHMTPGRATNGRKVTSARLHSSTPISLCTTSARWPHNASEWRNRCTYIILDGLLELSVGGFH